MYLDWYRFQLISRRFPLKGCHFSLMDCHQFLSVILNCNFLVISFGNLLLAQFAEFRRLLIFSYTLLSFEPLHAFALQSPKSQIQLYGPKPKNFTIFAVFFISGKVCCRAFKPSLICFSDFSTDSLFRASI